MDDKMAFNREYYFPNSTIKLLS